MSDDSEAWTDRDEEGPLADFPADASGELKGRANRRFREKAGQKYGRGRNWRACDEGEMLGEAQRKLLLAGKSLAEGEPDAALTAMADALNYVAFEADNVLADGDGEPGGVGA